MDHIGIDLDGTVLNYGAHHSEIRTNDALLAMLPPCSKITIVSNQGGIALGRITAKHVVKRLVSAVTFLEGAGHSVNAVWFATHHPKANDAEVQQAARQLRSEMHRAKHSFALPFSFRWTVFAAPKARKPSPYILKAIERRTGIVAYYGDSPEDAEAAKAAGISFVAVTRYE
jgi:histidinol phosphatase-like enzyme